MRVCVCVCSQRVRYSHKRVDMEKSNRAYLKSGTARDSVIATAYSAICSFTNVMFAVI